MNVEKTPEEQLVELASNEAVRIMGARRGSGGSLDDPCRLGVMHSLLAPMTEKFLVSYIYGKEDVDWFDAGRKYHKNGAICEQRVRLGDRVDPKLFWAQPGYTYSMFFDLSELTHEAPIPDDVKQFLMKAAAARWPVADTTFVSRFPLIEVRAENAVEAARVIRGHLKTAEAQGWKTGSARALVDDWRNEYELTKGNEKTVMQFDMRPCLLSDSSTNLTILTMAATNSRFEEGLREFRRLDSLMNPPAYGVGFYVSTLVVGILSLVLSLTLAVAAGTFLHSFLAGVIVWFFSCSLAFVLLTAALMKLFPSIYQRSSAKPARVAMAKPHT